MKMLLTSGILLFCVHLVASSALRHKREGPTQADKDEVVEHINKMRSELAKNGQIGNMNKVSWDEGMKSEMPTLCSADVPQDTMAAMQRFNKEATEENAEALMQNVASKSLISCFIPTQTKMHCSSENCGEHVVENCICGPEKEFKKEQFKKGKPGSKCDGDEKDGLCVDASSSLLLSGTMLNVVVFYWISSFVL